MPGSATVASCFPASGSTMPSVWSPLLATSNRPLPELDGGSPANANDKIIPAQNMMVSAAEMRMVDSPPGRARWRCASCQLSLWSTAASSFLARFFRGTIRARAELPQMIESVNAGRVSVVPENLQGVAAHQFRARRLQRLHSKHGKRAGRYGGLLGRRRLVGA